jgi:hypothetical protein
VLAETLIKNHGEDKSSRWDELFRRLISRLPSDQQRKVVQRLYDDQSGYFSSDDSAAKEFLEVGTLGVDDSLNQVDVAATTVVVQAMFAYDETIMLR